ncbi:MAG: PAS domain-containing protein, partial [Desulfohalobium sp.]
MSPRSLRTVLTRLFVRRLYVPCLILLVVGTAVMAGSKFYELRRHQQEVVGQLAQVLAWGSVSQERLLKKPSLDTLRQTLSQHSDPRITHWFFLPDPHQADSNSGMLDMDSSRQRLTGSALYQKALSSDRAVSGVFTIQGELALTTLYSVPRLGLIVGGSYPLIRFLAPVFVGFCLTTLIFTAFFALLARRVQHLLHSRVEKPLHVFTRNMERFEQGVSPSAQESFPFQELQELHHRFAEIAHSLKNRECELRQSQERLNLTVNSAGLGLWDWDLPSGHIYASSRCAEILDFPPYETNTRIIRWSRRVHPRDRLEVKRRLRAHLLGQEQVFEAEFQMLTRHNTWHWIWICGRIVQHDATDTPVRLTGTMLDIVKRKLVEEKLRTLTLAVAQNPVPMLISDAQGFLEYVNPAYLALTELTSDDVRQGLEARSGPQFVDGAFMRLFLDIVEQTGQWQGEIQNVTKSGRVFWEFTSISPLQNEHGEITHYVAVRSEITAQKQAESKLRDLATRDSLTGVWNRRYFFELAERELESALRYEHPL